MAILVPDRRASVRRRLAREAAVIIAREQEAAAWAALADELDEPLAVDNLLAQQSRTPETPHRRCGWVPEVPSSAARASLDQLAARQARTPGPAIRRELRGSTSDPHRDGAGTEVSVPDVAPRLHGRDRLRWGRPTRWQRAIDAVRDGWRDETGAPARP